MISNSADESRCRWTSVPASELQRLRRPSRMSCLSSNAVPRRDVRKATVCMISSMISRCLLNDVCCLLRGLYPVLSCPTCHARTQVRQLVSNLGHKDNGDLRERVLNRSLGALELVHMTTDDLAPDKLRLERKKAQACAARSQLNFESISSVACLL